MKYVETIGKEPFDWNAFLAKKSYTLEELIKAEELALDWVTCACGNQCEVIERNAVGAPRDPELTHLGVQFAQHIKYMRISWNPLIQLPTFHVGMKAKKCLQHIEQRSAFLINEYYHKQAANL